MFDWIAKHWPGLIVGLLLALLVVLMGGPACAADGALWVGAKVAPPHNEVTLSHDNAQVGRYLVEIGGEFEAGRMAGGAELNAWGMQPWQPPSLVGEGWKAWGDADWSVDRWKANVRPWLRYRVWGPLYGTYEGRIAPFGMDGEPYYHLFGAEVRAEF